MKVVSLLYTTYQNDSRVQKITGSLKANGYEVEVVALLEGDLPNTETVNNVHVTRIKAWSTATKKNMVVKALTFFSFMLKLAKRYRKADVWHCNDIEAFMFGVFAKMLRPKLILVYDAHELESHRNSVKKWVGKFFFFYEKLFARFAHTVITVSPGIENFYRKHFKIKRLVSIYNCPHAKLVTSNEKLKHELNIPNDQVLYLYLGGFQSGRGIEALLDIFSQLEKKHHVVFMGSGRLENTIKSYAEKHSNIHIKKAVPYQEILEWASGADYGLQSVEPTCLSYYYSLPNKMFEYIQSGLPIITNDLPDCRKIIEEHAIGYVLPKLDLENFQLLLTKLNTQDKASKSENLHQLKTIYNWESEEKKLLAIYSNIKL